MEAIKKVAVFPGTFDPPTLGHLDVIRRGRKLFDHLIVAIGHNPDKSDLFAPAVRLELLRELTAGMAEVTVESYDGLTVEFVRRRGAVAILRGLRNFTDLDYEFQLALTNRAVAGVETVFIMTGQQYGFTSSSLIRQMLAMGGDMKQLGSLLPELVIRRLEEQHGPVR